MVKHIHKTKEYESDLKCIKQSRDKILLKRLDRIIEQLKNEDPIGLKIHNLGRTSRDKSGFDNLKELHIYNEFLLVYRYNNNTLELIDICKNHKELDRKY